MAVTNVQPTSTQRQLTTGIRRFLPDELLDPAEVALLCRVQDCAVTAQQVYHVLQNSTLIDGKTTIKKSIEQYTGKFKILLNYRICHQRMGQPSLETRLGFKHSNITFLTILANQKLKSMFQIRIRRIVSF
jgi:hypothetical protein